MTGSNRRLHKRWRQLQILKFAGTIDVQGNGQSLIKGEVRRKMNITYVLGFVVLRDVAKVFPASSTSFAKKTTGKNRVRSHSGAWRGLKTKWDLKLSLPSPTYLHVAHPILVYLSRNNNSQAQARRFPALTAPAPEFPVDISRSVGEYFD